MFKSPNILFQPESTGSGYLIYIYIYIHIQPTIKTWGVNQELYGKIMEFTTNHNGVLTIKKCDSSNKISGIMGYIYICNVNIMGISWGWSEWLYSYIHWMSHSNHKWARFFPRCFNLHNWHPCGFRKTFTMEIAKPIQKLILLWCDIFWLLVWHIFYFSIIYGIILPIDWYFSRWLKPPTSYWFLDELLWFSYSPYIYIWYIYVWLYMHINPKTTCF